MKRTLYFIVLVFAFYKPINAQQANLIQYSSFCESDILVDYKYVQERINKVQRIDNFWRVIVTVIDDCNLNLYPTFHEIDDTIFINTNIIEKQLKILSSGDTINEMLQPEECNCAYLIKMDLNIDTISNLKINNKKLPITEERFQTFPIKYFTYKNDTTGYDDTYGLRQGYFIFEKNGYIIKQHFVDNELESCELYNSSGVLLESDSDCDKIYNILGNHNNNW